MSPRCPKRILRSIKANITFIIVLVVTFIALALIVALTFGSFYNNSKKSAITIGNMVVSEEARRIDNTLLLGINTLQVTKFSLEYMIEQGASPEVMQEYLIKQSNDAKANIDGSFSGIYGVVNDVYIDGLGWVPEAGYNPYDRPWYAAAKEKDGLPAIVSPYIDAQTNSIMISFSQMLSDGISAISMDMKLDDIYQAAETIQLNNNGYCFVVDSNGLVVAHDDEGEKEKNYLTDTDGVSIEMRQLVEKVYAANGEVFEHELEGNNSMIYSKSVQKEWYVVLVVNSRDLFKDIRASLFRNIMISLAIFILVGYFCTSNYMNQKKAIRYADEVRTDKLTGLNNRGEFDRFLSATISGIPEGKNLYLILFDADNFKIINDKFGHPEGDKALQYIADALRKVSLDSGSFCARYGGDEFVIVSKCENSEDTIAIAESVNKELIKVATEFNLPYRLSLSYGFAEHVLTEQSISELVDAADHVLYEMKAHKKQREQNKKY